jgi:hypothetical protein
MHVFKSIALLFVMAFSMASCSQQQVSFRRDINPILQTNCAVCHIPGGPGYIKSGFSVANYQDVMKGTKYGPVIHPGSSAGSTLVRLIKHQADPTINMPKDYSLDLNNHGRNIMLGNGARFLSDHDIGLISKWVDEGAKDN